MENKGNQNEKNGQYCKEHIDEFLSRRALIIASNRGPVTFFTGENGELEYERGGGGLVTALSGLTRNIKACWIAHAITEGDNLWEEGDIPIDDHCAISVKLITSEPKAYDGYYNVISNPLLWFLQHNMWDTVRAPNIDSATWTAWDKGYTAVNMQFAQSIAEIIQNSRQKPLIMIQDYHLYLVPGMVRKLVRDARSYTLLHFIHIPWPGAEDWSLLPPRMREAILEGLCGVDLLGFQTHEDSLNFIRTCESHLPRAHVNYRQGRVWYRNHATLVRDFPISIDVDALKELAESEDVQHHRLQLIDRFGERQLIVRVDRTEPSKNIVRGFQAFGEMLDLHPEHRGKVLFLALLVPSRMEVDEYQNYLDELMAAAGRVNASHGDSDWEPVRIIVGENYARAIAAMQIYNVLLVNSIADGMNLVAKEGPVVNRQDGVVVLSDRTGARQQMATGALIISPCDIYSTAEALHQALVMPAEERADRARRLRSMVESEDINDWLCRQIDVIREKGL